MEGAASVAVKTREASVSVLMKCISVIAEVLKVMLYEMSKWKSEMRGDLEVGKIVGRINLMLFMIFLLASCLFLQVWVGSFR